jgi:hypothetical protein
MLQFACRRPTIRRKAASRNSQLIDRILSDGFNRPSKSITWGPHAARVPFSAARRKLYLTIFRHAVW